MEHLETIVQQARTEYSDQDIVEQGADAQDLLAVIRSLMSDAQVSLCERPTRQN